MVVEINFNTLVKKLKDKNVYMISGNGTKNQFRDMRKVKGLITKILCRIEKNSVFLYFGDAVNKKKPDVGVLFQIIKEKRPDIIIHMIQIDYAKSWGVSSFVDSVYWHNDYLAIHPKCKWGGLLNGKPCSNTKKWVSLHKRLKNGITKIFILGGGEVTLDEHTLAKKYNIPFEYYPVERRYKGDGKTKIKDSDSKKVRVGITYHLAKE